MTKEQMLKRLNALNALKTTLNDKAKALIPADDSVQQTDEQKAQFIALMKEKGKLNEEIATLQAFINEEEGEAAPVARLGAGLNRQVEAPSAADQPRIYGRVRNFQDDKRANGNTAETKAYRFGMWFCAMMGVSWAAKKWNAMKFWDDGATMLGRPVSMMGEDSDINGGLFVPPEFEWDIITLREMYGIFRANTRVKPMTRDTLTIPRRVTGLTAYPVGEGQAITASSKTWNQVKLIAKKIGVISVLTNELDADSVVNLGDDLIAEIAYQFAYFEDLCGFTGDGTSTYHGIIGAMNKIQNPLNAASLPAVSAVSGLVQGTGSGAIWTSLLLTDFQAMIGKLPQYADTPNAKWFMHKTFFETVAKKLALAAGGVTGNEIMDGVRRREFLGYPVVFSQVMPKVAVLKQTACLLGDLALASKMGDRRAMTIARSTDASLTDERGATVSLFTQDANAIRAIERIDINNHDYGDTNATAASQNPGPMIGMVAPQS